MSHVDRTEHNDLRIYAVATMSAIFAKCYTSDDQDTHVRPAESDKERQVNDERS